MNKEIIEKYIQFGIDNWYKPYSFADYQWYESWSDKLIYIDKDDFDEYWDNLIQTITSKEFIEAIARWLYIWDKSVRVKIDSVFNKLIDDITFEQALAIRDNKLEEFILSIIK